MLERPNLADTRIIDCLKAQFGFERVALEFLPIGNDTTAWVYKVSADQDRLYFLKIKHGMDTLASVLVPHYLYSSGIRQVVAPVTNRAAELWTPLDDFVLILYPFIDGQSGMEIGFSDQQWVDLGATLKQIHATRFPPDLIPHILREPFTLNPKWMKNIQSIQYLMTQSDYQDDFQKELAVFWREHTEEITSIINRGNSLGQTLQKRSLALVLCHSDIHTANVLIDRQNQLHIVDWDQPILAPKERDLMHILSQPSYSETEQAFLRGYGQTEVNWLTVVYYRYEWVVQEISDYGERVFLMPNVGDITKSYAVQGFKQIFLSGDVVEQARESEQWLR